MSVTYLGEPDVAYEFSDDGDAYVFGRDADAADIVIWSALNDASLSRTAGRIWLMDGELWLRNLSSHHDLLIEVPGMPPEPYLPPRRGPGDRGPARSLPPQTCMVIAPAGCELLVRQSDLPSGSGTSDDGDDPEQTVRLPDVPDHLQGVALALCGPLMSGSRLPASYAQVAEAIGTTSIKRVRILVGELCALYTDALPQLAERARARQQRESELLSAVAQRDVRQVGGVWRFEVRDELDDDGERERRRALMLPDYFEVAHLLVRRGLIRRTGP